MDAPDIGLATDFRGERDPLPVEGNRRGVLHLAVRNQRTFILTVRIRDEDGYFRHAEAVEQHAVASAGLGRGDGKNQKRGGKQADDASHAEAIIQAGGVRSKLTGLRMRCRCASGGSACVRSSVWRGGGGSGLQGRVRFRVLGLREPGLSFWRRVCSRTSRAARSRGLSAARLLSMISASEATIIRSSP